MTHYSDAELLKMLGESNAGSRDKALKSIYETAHKMIEQMIIKNNGSEQDAEDIFHDGLIVFYKQVKDGLSLTCKINSYLYSVCRNLWMNRLRKAGRSEGLKDQHMNVVDLNENPESFLIKDNCATIVADHLKKLGDTCRKIVTYSYFDRHSAEEVAKLMGYANAQVARNKKSGCLKKFRDLVLKNKDSDSSLRQCLEAYV